LMWSLWPKAKQMDGKEGRREEEEGQIWNYINSNFISTKVYGIWSYFYQFIPCLLANCDFTN
jgi:hypothetical protein